MILEYSLPFPHRKGVSIRHGRQELSTRLEAYGEGTGRPCCSEEDPRQRETSGDSGVRRSMKHDVEKE
jgi:hypothetical protein